jgi:uncharacterized protein (TIGR02145 family)
MVHLKKHISFGIWFFLVILTIIQCKKEASSPVEKIEYTGQSEVVFDIDGNSYQAKGAGTQIWMSQNLRTSRLNNGNKINLVSNDLQWESLSNPGYCWYNNDSTKNEKFGALYNLYSVATGLLCPTGWHVPTQNDWNTLIKYFGGTQIAGGKMKSHYTDFWDNPPDYAKSPIFMALPGGFRNSVSNKQFTNIDTAGYWWTYASKSDSGYSSIVLKASSTAIHSSYFSKNDGLSIRCIKD